ncbi:hypothetical protein ACWC09_29930 [Streptomyces sp. NPDC001617]
MELRYSSVPLKDLLLALSRIQGDVIHLSDNDGYETRKQRVGSRA